MLELKRFARFSDNGRGGDYGNDHEAKINPCKYSHETSKNKGARLNGLSNLSAKNPRSKIGCRSRNRTHFETVMSRPRYLTALLRI